MNRTDCKRTESRLSERGVGYSLFYEEETASTNDTALAFAAGKTLSKVVFIAGKQTKGKGRRGRSWDTGNERSLTFSVLIRPKIPPVCFPTLTVLMGLAVAEAIEQVCGIPTGIKWPNDVIVCGKKVCGILTETDPKMTCAVIGTGINISYGKWPADLADKAVSLTEAGCDDPDEGLLLADLLERFDAYLKIFTVTCDLSGIRENYEKKLIRPDDGVIVKDPKGDYAAHIEGVCADGALIVKRKDDGRTVILNAGEISIRGTDRYI